MKKFKPEVMNLPALGLTLIFRKKGLIIRRPYTSYFFDYKRVRQIFAMKEGSEKVWLNEVGFYARMGNGAKSTLFIGCKPFLPKLRAKILAAIPVNTYSFARGGVRLTFRDDYLSVSYKESDWHDWEAIHYRISYPQVRRILGATQRFIFRDYPVRRASKNVLIGCKILTPKIRSNILRRIPKGYN